jgi:hypothetical protein
MPISRNTRSATLDIDKLDGSWLEKLSVLVFRCRSITSDMSIK